MSESAEDKRKPSALRRSAWVWIALAGLVALGAYKLQHSPQAERTAAVKVASPHDAPLTYWADPQHKQGPDDCVRATAQAILKSGLPYPNITTETVAGPDGKPRTQHKTVDVWVGATRYVMPAALVGDNGMYGRNNPARFWKLHGTLPRFYPPGPPGPVVDGMGAMVDVTIVCSMEPAYLASYGKGYHSNEEGIARVKQRYEDELKTDPRFPGTVTVSVREDLGMTEVLLDRGHEANNRRFWEASYWPLDRELTGPTGGVSGIGCKTRHDPQKRYGHEGWRCTSGMRLTPESYVSIDIYVSQIQHMPAIFDQVRQLFADIKQTN